MQTDGQTNRQGGKIREKETDRHGDKEVEKGTDSQAGTRQEDTVGVLYNFQQKKGEIFCRIIRSFYFKKYILQDKTN